VRPPHRDRRAAAPDHGRRLQPRGDGDPRRRHPLGRQRQARAGELALLDGHRRGAALVGRIDRGTRPATVCGGRPRRGARRPRTIPASDRSQEATPVEYRLEDAHALFRRLLPMLDRVATGFTFTEGPVWRGDDLLFSDIPSSRTIRYRPLAEGPEITTFRHPTGNANGLTLDRQGNLLACEHTTRRVTRIDGQGRVETLAEAYQGRRLNSPNDVVVRSDGPTFFT